MASNLGDFITKFARYGRTEDSYGTYFALEGKNSEVLIHADVEGSLEVDVVMVRTKLSDGNVFIFFNDSGLNNNRYSYRNTLRDAAKSYSPGGNRPLPTLLGADKDLTSLRIEDINQETGDILINLPNGKFLMTHLPRGRHSKEQFLAYTAAKDETIGADLVIVPVSSTCTKATRESIIPKNFTPNMFYFYGAWLEDLNRSEIPEFNPYEHEIKLLASKPVASSYIPAYDFLLATARDGALLSDIDVDSFAIPCLGTGAIAPIFKQSSSQIEQFQDDLVKWKKMASEITKKYLGFERKMFLLKHHLCSLGSFSARYFFDDRTNEHFVKGVLTQRIEYDKAVISKGALALDTWHKIIPVAKEIIDGIV